MKNLILCLDGTWSDADRPAPQTNIAIIASIIDPNPASGVEQRVAATTRMRAPQRANGAMEPLQLTASRPIPGAFTMSTGT